ncbi:MAG: hypothetical protein NTU81_03680 [Candidatus Nomurabacteria bacterium]|nr:hypothetical protein [Candidatus Nomurabacteria bacterium]
MSTNEKVSGRTLFKWIALGIAIFLFLIAISTFIKSFKTDLFNGKNETESTNQNGVNSSNQNNYIWVEKDVKYIPLNSEFGNKYNLLHGDGFSFENSTVPYCVINGNNHSECGTINEDLSSKFGKEIANDELRFKSNNSQNGILKLVIWEKKFK